MKIKRSTLLTLALSLTTLAAPAAMADFMDGNSDAQFQSSLDSFSSSLDSLPSRQRREDDYSNASESHRYLTNMQANQTDTQATAQQSFQNTQEQMVLSGGAYNTQGNYGYGMGGMGFGMGMGMGMGMGGGSSQITPDNWGSGAAPAINTPNYGGRYYRRSFSNQ